MRCKFALCTYDATDHWTGTQEELLFVLEEHVSTDYTLHTAELVDGYVTRRSWDTFKDWWSDYKDMLTYKEQVHGTRKDIRDYFLHSWVEQGVWSCKSWGWTSSWPSLDLRC